MMNFVLKMMGLLLRIMYYVLHVTGGKPRPPAPPSPPAPIPTPPAPPGSTHFADPDAGCQKDEDVTSVSGVKGSFCSPRCETNSSAPSGVILCPTDLPARATATALCVIKPSVSIIEGEVPAVNHCAMVCMGGLECPAGASCKPFGTPSGAGSTEICTYLDA